ncbi:NACHT domain-containing protein [Streptomyces gilvosporeus]|nr:NACHT domain-containing protein [Streptomyces gilvosporeus]
MPQVTIDNLPWLIAAALFLLLIVRDWVKKKLTALLDWIYERTYSRLAGSTLFRRSAVRRYAAAVQRKNESVPIPFLENRPLKMRKIYVPATLETGHNGEHPDAAESIRSVQNAIVLGVPGAGKSMLLRHSILSWADNRMERRRHRPRHIHSREFTEVPILVKLHRLNGNEKDIRQLIVEEFQRNDFPRAEKFVTRSLKEGRLIALLDGLDEVTMTDRARSTQTIKDFIQEFDRCRVIVTCRSAVYQDTLSDALPNVFRISEFDERLIRRFLSHWMDINPQGSVEELMVTLRDTPRLMQLARNPLLLTMIAYLYTDAYQGQGQNLPRTRADFYEEVVDVMLRRWHDEHNHYAAREKRRVLQRLALTAQDIPQYSLDRLTVPEAAVREVTCEVLEDTPLDPKDHEVPLLREILERSGLLLEVDGGERYQFAHLTLQEYLAARQLLNSPTEIVARYRRDPATWRETVRLWCGAANQDCAPVINNVFQLDQCLAFECLADAQHLANETADRVIRHFQESLGTLDDPQVIKAFGTVASDPRPRGKEILRFLADKATKTDESSSRRAAVAALAATNLPAVATTLAGLLGTAEGVRESITSMGDIAVDALGDASGRGCLDAVEPLATIGTPNAARKLADICYDSHSNGRIAVISAWHLAAMIRIPEIEESLRWHAPRINTSTAIDHSGDWFGARFEADQKMRVLANRIGCLLGSNDASGKEAEMACEAKPDSVITIDRRIGIPLATGSAWLPDWSQMNVRYTAASHDLEKLTGNSPGSAIRMRYHRGAHEDHTVPLWELLFMIRHSGRTHPELSAEEAWSILERIISATVNDGASHRAIMLLRLLSPKDRIALIQLQVANTSRALRESWVDASREVTYPQFRYGIHYRIAIALTVLITAAACHRAVLAGTGISPWGPGWLGWTAVGAIVTGWIALIADGALVDEYTLAYRGLAGLLTGPIDLIDGIDAEDRLLGLATTLFAPMTFFFSFLEVMNSFGVFTAALSFILWMALVAALCWRGWRLARIAHAPFREMFDSDRVVDLPYWRPLL